MADEYDEIMSAIGGILARLPDDMPPLPTGVDVAAIVHGPASRSRPSPSASALRSPPCATGSRATASGRPRPRAPGAARLQPADRRGDAQQTRLAGDPGLEGRGAIGVKRRRGARVYPARLRAIPGSCR
jgi:hypothetical protein